MKNLFSTLLGFMLLAGMAFGQTISMTSPNGGENLDGCTTHTIAWTATSTSNSFSIDYSIDNGANWTSVASFYFTTTGTFSWQVPNVTSTNCLVRVYDSNAPSVRDSSSSVFSINGPLILQTPNGGENWIAGTIQNISWFASGTSNIYKLEYSTNNGANWLVIANNLNNTTGTYNWTVPNLNTTQALIRITDINNAPCMSDKSDGVFSITSTILLTTPNGGQSFTATVGPNGGSYNMNNATVVANTGNFYDNGGRTGNYSGYQNVGETFYPDDPNLKLSFTFTEFRTNNSSDYLRIYDGPSTSSPSLGTFSGTSNPGTVTSTHKTGALTFRFVSNASGSQSGWRSYFTTVSGPTQPINWTITGTSGLFNLEFSSTGGANWVTIIRDYPSTTGSFDWPVPNVVTSAGRIRVVDAGNANILDASNTNFSISAATPSMLLCSPNGGEQRYAGTVFGISWRSGFTSNANVRLEYSTNNGTTWANIIASTLNDGSYSWTVPNTPSTNCLVRVSEVGNPAAFDVSNNVFTIKPHYRIASPNGGESLLGCNRPSISWEQGGISNYVDLHLSTDGGTSWLLIANNIYRNGSTPSYNWTTNNITSTNCLIRVRDHNDTLKMDVSDAPFTVNATSNAVVNQPNGGEFWVAGGTFPIVYVLGGGVTNVKIEYSANNGLTWSTIVSNTSGGLYNWTIPNINTNQALIRVTDVNNSCNIDISDAVFNILSEVTVAVPNGGETYQATGGPNGGIYRMNTTSLVTLTTGNLYDNGGPNSNYSSNQNVTRTIKPFNPAAKMRVTFSDFALGSGDYLRVYDGPGTSYPLLGTFSGSTNPGTLTSSYKTGELTFRFSSNSSGSNRGWKAHLTSYSPSNPDITWNVTGTSGIFDLDYSTDGGVTWIMISDDVAATTTGTYSWAVANTVTSNARVRVIDAGNYSIVDETDNAFSITAANPVYLQCYPNGGEIIYAGNTATLKWATAFSTSPYVKIELSTDNGTTWTTAIASTFNDGTEPWPIPNTPSTNCLMRVTDTANPANTDTSDTTFTIRPYLTVQNPNGGETLTGCTGYVIGWQNGGTSNYFDLEYSLDSGATWSTIINNYLRSQFNATYTWSVPNLNSTTALIRVTDHNDAGKTDMSDAIFTFQPSQNVQVINPNGGQNMVAGTTYPIVYTVQGGVTSVRIEYSTNGGTTWLNVSSSTSGGTYNWTVPNRPTNQALIKVTSTSNSCNFDESDATFNILSDVTVLSPNGGESLVASGGINGGSHLLNSATDLTVTTGNFYDNGGFSGNYSNYQNVTKTIYPYNPHAKLQVAFHEFQTANSSDILRIYDGPSAGYPLIGTYSGASSPGTVTSTHKTGALTFRFTSNGSGQQSGWRATMTTIAPGNQLLSWSKVGTSGEYNLEVTTNNGTSWTRIVSKYASLSNTFSWATPNTPSTQAKVRVIDYGNSSIVDMSDSVFSISAGTPAYVLCYPIGGETVYAGSTRNITWRSGFTTNPNVKIELSTDNGTTWSTVTNSTFDSGTYSWAVPNSPSTSCLIRVSDASNPGFFDQSDSVFTILPNLELTSPNGGNSLTGCTSHIVRWQNGGTSNRFDLYYSINAGATWTTITTNLYQSTLNATYSWPVPNVISSQCLVRVVDHNDFTKADTSDNFFSISPTLNVQVGQPNGGENLVSGIIYPINYTVQGGVNTVKIEYSIDSGNTWATLSNGVSTGTFNWTIPNSPTTRALIKMTDISNSCNFDISDTTFNILSNVTVLSPNGGETIRASGGNNGGIYRLDNSTEVVTTTGNFYDNGGPYSNYSSNQYVTKTFYPYNPASKLQMNFHKFQTHSSSDYLQIFDGPTTGYPMIGSYSGTSAPGVVTSTHKTGALTFRFRSNSSGTHTGWSASITSIHADNHLISWTNTGTSGEYNLEVSTNGGSGWTRIVTGYISGTNTYSWAAPNSATNTAMIRVLDRSNGYVRDVSDSVFTINTTTPEFLVCYPNGGETFYAGTVRTLTWRSGFTTNPYILLELSADNGTTWSTIASNVFNNGTYSWTVPNTLSTTALIRVSDNSNAIYSDVSDSTFIIRPYITVVAPNGGENITGCTNTTIRWENGGTSNRFDLFYSTDAGSNWTSIVTNLYQGSLNASYSWSAPNVISSQCLIRIVDTNDPIRTDTSDNLFNINPSANVQVVSPNGGEIWVAGAIYPINYSLQGGVSTVKIEYSRNGGTTWFQVVNSTSGGTYNWTLPNFASTNTMIRITDVSNPCNFDISNAPFTVLSEIDLLTPNGGDTVRASVVLNGGSYRLNTTTSVHLSSANFYDAGGPASNYPAYSNTTRTFYPENPTHKMQVSWYEFRTHSSSDVLRVYDGPSTGYPLIGSYSGTGIPPVITSTHKTGALTFRFTSNGSGQSIGWRAYLVSAGPDNVPVNWNTIGTSGKFALEYSTNNGTNWTNILQEYVSSTGSFSWPVPNTPSSTAKFRVRDYTSGSILDDSDTTFVINPGVPVLTVCTPNGGESFSAGNSYNITWGSIFLSAGSVKIEYSTDTGSSWNLITPAVVNSGSYIWTVPNTPSVNCLIRVTDFGNPGNTDQSDSVFTIRPHITVTRPNGGEIVTGCNNNLITWLHGGTSNSFKLEYSTTGGGAWNYITTVTAGGASGTYSWNAPNINASNCSVRISDANDISKVDSSDAPFTMQQTFDVTVNSPNGGENWVAGTQQNIIYTLLNGVTNVRLEYSTNNGANWLNIVSNTSGGSYTWTIPNRPSGQVLIRARDINNSCKADVSDTTFNIISTVQVATPNGGEIWQGQVGTPGGVFTMSSTSVTCNSGNFFDNGGENSNYSNYANYTETFYPDISTNKTQVTFTEFQTYSSSDVLRIYDGPTTGSPLIGNYSGTSSPGTVTSTHATGALTFRFTSNSTGTHKGWEAYIGNVGSPTQNVTWSATGTSGFFNVDYSTNSGLTWTNIIQEYPGVNGGIYPWQIPNTPSTNCRVRVLDHSNGSIVDQSDADFTIGAATPHMYAPNGGESVFSGVGHTIKWDSPTYLSTNVQLEYSTDGGLTWSLIEAFTFNDGTYLWTPPVTVVTLSNCLIRVSESGNTIAFDVSDQPFTINPAVRVTSPNSNAGNFRGCTVSTISWVAGASSNYRIELSVDSGSTWSTVEANYINSNSVVNYPWSIPNTPSTNCLVRVTDNNNPTRTDRSDSVFTITPTITITQPNFSGQQLQGGSNFTIKWNSNVVSNFYDIDYTTNGGSTWLNVVTNYFTTTDDYVWMVPATVTPSALIRVRDNLDNCKEDISNYPFSIQAAAPAITITAPNGGENLSGCSSYAITWTELTTSGFFNIDYSADGGATWVVIVSNYNTASSSYLWTVPNVASNMCVVRVTDAANAQKQDVSNQTFTIAQSLTATITASGSSSICSGDTLYLTSSSAVGNIWTPFGQTTQTIAVTSSGNYSVSVSQGGCTAISQAVAVTVNASPATPVISASGSTTLCSGDNVVLTSSSPSGNTWSNSATTQAISVNTAGIYSVTTTNQFGCATTSGPVTVTVNPLPATPVASSNSPVITGGTLSLFASTVTGATYNWTGPNGYTSSMQNPSINNAMAAMSGNYSVTATVNGCTSTSSSVTVNVVPPGGIATVSGTILSELGDSIRTVSVSKTGFGGLSTQVTGLNGYFQYNLTANQNYTLTPSKANDSTTNNGLTTLDIILMRRHILNDDTLGSAYKVLAGDVNFSNSVSTLDIVLTRQVILQNNPTFPGGRLWTFVNSDFVFANPVSPWPYEGFRTYPSVATASGQNFIGVKLGDVNNSWSPSVAKQGYVGELGMDMEGVTAEVGDIISIPVRVRDFEAVSGYQFTLQWDVLNLEYMGFENGLLNGQFGESQVSSGKLSTSWDDENGESVTLEDGAKVFTVNFLVKGQMGHESMVYISSAMTSAEGYNSNLGLLSLNTTPAKVVFGGAEAQAANEGFALGQNIPNPFDSETEIAFRVPETSQVQFTIFGLDGRTVRTMSGAYEAGVHKLSWNGETEKGERLVSGIYYIRMTASDFTATRKMVLMHR